MLPPFLRPEVFPYASIEIVRESVREPKVVCAWCLDIIRDGAVPVRWDACAICTALFALEGDR